jgi:hypothetical protein
MFCVVFMFSNIFRVFEEKQVFLASFKLKRQFGKTLEAIGLSANTRSRIERNSAQAPKPRD